MPRRASRPWIQDACKRFPRIAAAVELREPERLPVFLFGVNPYCASFAGVRYSDCMLDPQLYAECIIRMAEHFRPDGLLNVGSSLSRAVLDRCEVVEINDVRHLRERETGEIIVRVPEDGNVQMLRDGKLPAQADAAEPPDPDAIRVPSVEELQHDEHLGIVRQVLAELGGSMLISRGVCNASNQVVNWLGLEQTCLLMRQDPGYIKALAQRGTEMTCVRVQAQARAGLRLYYTGGSWGALFGPADYEEFFADSQVRINQASHESGGLALLHLTGQQNHLLEANLASEPDIVLLDEDDLAETKAAYGDRACLAGHIDPNLLLGGSPDAIRREVARQVAVAGPAGFIVCTTDCIVKDTPVENVEAMIAAAREAG